MNVRRDNRMQKAIIRKAVREDMKQVILLIKELAVYEHMQDRLELTAEILERDGFDLPNPLFQCYVAQIKDQIVGYALYYYTYSTWQGKSIYMEDLFVKADFRMQGIGKSMFQEVAKEALKCRTRLDFQVLAWNPALKFYQKLGALNITELEHWNTLRMDRHALENFMRVTTECDFSR